jgi:hypothetical protein
MAKATTTPTANETARELKSALENQIVTVRHAARIVADCAKDWDNTRVSMEWLASSLAADAQRMHDIWRDWFVADRRARGIPDPTLPAEAVLR